MIKLKNPNGYGCVVKLGGKRRRPYAVRITKGRESGTGKQLCKYLGYFEDYREANKFLVQYNDDPSSIREIPTLEDLYNLHIENMETRQAKEKTIAMYKTAWTYFKEYEKEKITDIKSVHIRDIIADLIDKGYSYSTLNQIKVLYSQMCKIAMENDYINKNYAQFVKLPKKPKPDNTTFTMQEVESLFKLAKIDQWAQTILIMIYACLRPSEMLLLNKFNIDLENRTMIGGIKTEAGENRTIPISNKILPFVKTWHKKSKSEFLITRNGSKINYRYYLEYLYYPTLEKAGVPLLTPHKCRKTGITMLKKAGADSTYVQQIVGHEDYSTTVKYYTDVDKDSLVKTIDLL